MAVKGGFVKFTPLLSGLCGLSLELRTFSADLCNSVRTGAVFYSCVQCCAISIEWPCLHVMLGAERMFTKIFHACASSRGGKKTNF